MTQLIKNVKQYVGASVILGAGSSVLGQMGQGTIANQVVTPAANMMGPVITAGLGMGLLNSIDKQTRKYNKGKRY